MSFEIHFCDEDTWPEYVAVKILSESETRKYIPERTCYSDNEPPLLYDDPFRVFRCSECHSKLDLRHARKPNYCPHCGAKVVSE